MNIKITDQAIRQFIDTPMTPGELAKTVSLCGPTFDRIHSIDDDVVYDVEIITNRIDTVSAQGLARDAHAILKQQGIPAQLINDPYLAKTNSYSHLPRTFNFEISDPNFTPRFVAVSLENVQIKDSPLETQNLLTRCGERPINNLVDITNELTLLYGIPCHVFDLDKLAPQKLLLRLSRPNEVIKTLDNQINTLKGDDLIFEDGAGRLVDLCGIMGGAIAETDIHTKNILFIVPIYQPNRIRRTSLYLQKRTLASQIYEKQPDVELCLPVLTKAISLLKECTGATVSSSIFDYYPNPTPSKTIDLDLNWLNSFIGISISSTTVISILKNLGFKIIIAKDHLLQCTVPSWRSFDVNIKEDLAEEVARVYGYFKLSSKLPNVNLLPQTENILLTTETKIRHHLSPQGFCEIYNNSLISVDLLKKTGLDPQNHLKLTNALSSDFEYLRTALLPSLIQNLNHNQGKTNEPLHLFEISNTYQKTDKKVPDEISHLALISAYDYFHLKGILESLFQTIHLPQIRFSSTSNCPSYFQKESTAEIYSNGKLIGFIGQLKTSIQRDFNLPSVYHMVEIDLPLLASHISPVPAYSPISEYPEIVESLTLVSALPIGDIIEKLLNANSLVKKIDYTSSYKNKHTFKVFFVSQNKNLTQDEVNRIKTEIQKNFN